VSETRAVLEVSVIVYDDTAEAGAAALAATLMTVRTDNGGEVEIVSARVTESLPLRPRYPALRLPRDLAAEGAGEPDAEDRMTEERNRLLAMIRAASTGQEQASAVAALDQFDRRVASLAQADRELDLGATIAARRLTPVPIHEHHTAATDWLGEADVPDGSYRTAMIAEASAWWAGLDPEVRADAGEFAEQARGRARTLASAHGSLARQAEAEFLQMAGYLRGAQGASGLPQIDQLVDPNNQPSATPYPTEVFPTFGDEQDPFNQVETNNHQSGASSMGAPLIQQVEQMNNSGSGYGTGPEKPDQHSTGFDTSNSYAEVPLGPPGQISTAPAATDSQAGSAPNPILGQPQDAGAEQRRTAVIAGYSMPDPFGYRWAMSPEVTHPFHERCGSAHWPEESCEDRAHTASMAVGYLMNLDAARRAAQCEAVGVREGLRAIASADGPKALGAAHNRFTAAWGDSDRTIDDTAVLHGFMAVVRPVLAEVAHTAAIECTACKGGDCANCDGRDCGCAKHGMRTTAAGGLAAGGVTESEREHATHHLPGPGDKFPVSSGADVLNGEHDIGRTNEPKAKVVRYLDDMAKEYGVHGVGGH
jgi:hypothetical protein